MRTVFQALFASLTLVCGSSHGADVLHVILNGTYNTDAQKISGTLSGVPGATVQTVVLGMSAFPSDLSAFEQIWVTDFSTGSDSYATAYQQIAGWYTAHNQPDAIFDGRILADLQGTLNTALITNYYANLDQRGFGLVIGTDHNTFHSNGANTLAQALNFTGFSGNFGVVDADVDSTHVVMNFPGQAWYLNGARKVVEANTTPAMVPFNLQPNGEVLHGIAWANANLNTPLISTTIPEPQAATMFLLGGFALASLKRARRNCQ